MSQAAMKQLNIKRLALTITTTLLTLAVILVLWQLLSIVLLFVFSLLIAAALRGPIEHLRRRQWPQWAAMALVYILILLGLAGLATMVILPLAAELETLAQDLVQIYERGYGLVQPNAVFSNELLRRLPPTEMVGQFLSNTQPTLLVQRVLGFTQNFAYFAGQTILAIVISIYWTADQWHFERLWLSLLPPTQRSHMRDVWHRLENRVGAYIQSEIVQSIIGGGLLTLGFWLMGVKYPFLLATIGATAWFIPLVGALFSLPLMIVVALLTSIPLTIVTVLYTIIVYLFLEYVVEPRLYNRHNNGAILVILVMMTMVEIWGVLGLLLAPPLALAIQIALDEIFNAPTLTSSASVITLSELEEQVQQLQTEISSAEAKSPRIASLVERLKELLQETKAAAA